MVRPLIMTDHEEVLKRSNIHVRIWEEISEIGKHEAELRIVTNAQKHGLCGSYGKHPTTLRDVVGCIQSQHWMNKFEANRVDAAIAIYKICIKPLEQRDLALRATTTFLGGHGLTFWDSSAAGGQKNSIFKIARAAGLGYAQSMIHCGLEDAYGFSIRTERPQTPRQGRFGVTKAPAHWYETVYVEAAVSLQKGVIYLRHQYGNEKSKAKPDDNTAYNHIVEMLAITSRAAGKSLTTVKEDIEIKMSALEPGAKEDKFVLPAHALEPGAKKDEFV